MQSNTPQNKRLRLILLVLVLLVAAETVWLVRQNQSIQTLQESEFSITNGTIQELIMDMDAYSQTHNPVLLGQIHVRFRYLDEQTQRMINYRKQPVSYAHPITPTSVTWQMMEGKIPPEQVSTHLQTYKELLKQYQDRNADYTDVERNQFDLIALWGQLREAAFLTNRQLNSP